MKEKITKFIKLSLFITLLYSGCYNDKNKYLNDNFKPILEHLSFDQLEYENELSSILPSIKKVSTEKFSKSKTKKISNELVLKTNLINKVINKEVITWTFLTEYNILKKSDFENFLIKKNKSGFSYYLISYKRGFKGYDKVTAHKVPEKLLTAVNLDFLSKGDIDWVPNEDGGDNTSECEGVPIMDYSPCQAGNSNPHGPSCQHSGAPHYNNDCDWLCSGTPVLILDFSHCTNYQPYEPNYSDTNDTNTDPSTSGGSGTSSDDSDSTLTSPVDIEDPNCPKGSGKIMKDGVCVCPDNTNKIEDENGKCVCPKGKVENENGICVEDCNTSSSDIKKVFPNISDNKAKILANLLNNKGSDFGINKNEDLWHFLSQAGHETGGFNKFNVTESTNYKTADRLATMYKRFTMDSVKAKDKEFYYYAPDFINKPEAVANIAMCCKFENGNPSSGDGYRYRGRGLFQLTWKENYRKFKIWYNNKYDPDIDPITNPDIISTNDTLAVISGLWYFKQRVLNKISIDSTTSVSKVTKPINSKLAGLKDRKRIFKKAKDSIKCL